MEDKLTACDKHVANEQRENLARVSHEIWAHWMNYMFGQCDGTTPVILSALSDGSLIIPEERAGRWMRQMNTPYDELTELEKESDRHQADKIIAALDGEYRKTYFST